jgi:uncharacterized protein involved in exopolysaccharide biosynthesis
MAVTMSTSSKPSIGPVKRVSLAALKPAAIVVALAGVGAMLPLSMPSLTQDGYRASTQLILDGAEAFSVAERQTFQQFLVQQLTSDQALSRAMDSLKLSPAALNIVSEPSLSALIGDLIGVTDSTAVARDEQVMDALRKRISIAVPAGSNLTIELSLLADQEKVAREFLQHLALMAQSESTRYQTSNIDIELSQARQALDNVEAEYSGFKMRIGEDKIAPMLALETEFKANLQSVENLRRSLRDIQSSVQLAKSIKPAQALDQALPATIGFDALRDLQTEYVGLKALIAGLGADYGPKHPKVLAAQGSLDSIKATSTKALQQSVEALQLSENAAQSRLKAAELHLAGLDERLSKLGNAPDEFALIEKRLETARTHYLTLADLTQGSQQAVPTTLNASLNRITATPQSNGLALAAYSVFSSMTFAALGSWLTLAKRRRKQAPLPDTAVSPQFKRVSIDEIVARRKALSEAVTPPVVTPMPVQDNATPFDQQVKALLMRHAVPDRDKQFTTLPPLIRAAALGQIELTQAELKELDSIHQELAMLREAIAEPRTGKSLRRSAM